MARSTGAGPAVTPATAAPAERLVVATPDGPAEILRFPSTAAHPVGTVVLGHGAGRGPDTEDLLACATGLPAMGVDVLLARAPWVVAGRRVAAAPSRLDAAWVALVTEARSRGWTPGRLVAGGRSAGARVAARTAGMLGVDACLLLAFPLHPPGRPARSRGDELASAAAGGRPVVVVQGERDAFGTPAEVVAALSSASADRERVRVVALAGADHSLRHRASSPLTLAEWCDALVGAAASAVRAGGARASRGRTARLPVR